MDVWSAACILAEMITGKVLFPGHDSIHTCVFTDNSKLNYRVEVVLGISNVKGWIFLFFLKVFVGTSCLYLKVAEQEEWEARG